MPAPTDDEAIDAAALGRLLQPGWVAMLDLHPGGHGPPHERPGSRPRLGRRRGQGRAVADVARAVELARRLADEEGTGRVTAIEVHSAPGPEQGSISSLARSLATIADWDLAGAQIVLEHCDALVPGQTPAKGFLSLADEIAAIHAAGDPEVVGIGINWGRSAIEGRSTSTPVEHVLAAREAHLLRAVVLSGATDAATAWGAAWSDAHIPSHGADPALAASSASAMGAPEIAAVLAAAGPDVLRAVKVSARPRDLRSRPASPWPAPCSPRWRPPMSSEPPSPGSPPPRGPSGSSASARWAARWPATCSPPATRSTSTPAARPRPSRPSPPAPAPTPPPRRSQPGAGSWSWWCPTCRTSRPSWPGPPACSRASTTR